MIQKLRLLFTFCLPETISSVGHLLFAISFLGHVHALDDADLLAAECPYFFETVPIFIKVHQRGLIGPCTVLIRVTASEDTDSILFFGSAPSTGVDKLFVVDSPPFEVGELNDFQYENHEGKDHIIYGHHHELVAPGDKHKHVRVHQEDWPRLKQKVDHCRNKERLD